MIEKKGKNTYKMRTVRDGQFTSYALMSIDDRQLYVDAMRVDLRDLPELIRFLVDHMERPRD